MDEIEILDFDQEESFKVIEQYGEDLTKKTYITNPAIAREEEIRRLILVLLTPEKSGKIFRIKSIICCTGVLWCTWYKACFEVSSLKRFNRAQVWTSVVLKGVSILPVK